MKLLLVDGYSLLYRAYFSSPPLTTREGKPTGEKVRTQRGNGHDCLPHYGLGAVEMGCCWARKTLSARRTVAAVPPVERAVMR